MRRGWLKEIPLIFLTKGNPLRVSANIQFSYIHTQGHIWWFGVAFLLFIYDFTCFGIISRIICLNCFDNGWGIPSKDSRYRGWIFKMPLLMYWGIIINNSVKEHATLLFTLILLQFFVVVVFNECMLIFWKNW